MFRSVAVEALTSDHHKTKVYVVPRSDGRRLDELRPVFKKCGVVGSCDGSAYIEVGKTKLTCSIVGPQEINRSSDMASSDFGAKCVVSAKVHFVPFAKTIRLRRKKRDQETDEEISLSRALSEAFLPAVRMEQYPKSRIDMFVTVIEDDGAVLSAALTCCTLALIDAGIEMFDVVIGACVKVVDDVIICDPNSEQENDTPVSNLSANFTLALMPSLNQVTKLTQVGELTTELFAKAMKSLNDSCYKMYPLVQETIVKSFKVKSK